MHRDDRSRFLLYIEPTVEQKSQVAVNDEYVQIMRLALMDAQTGTSNYSSTTEPETFTPGSGYKGVHTCADGTRSDSHDYLLPNGLITNSLCIHYLLWYRSAIKKNDWEKLDNLLRDYGRVGL